MVSAERSWWAELKKSEKKIFWPTAAILETKMAAKMGKNRVSSAQFFWKVCQWNSIFIVDFFWLKGFLGRDREFFFQFQSSIFFAGAYPYRCQFVMIFSYNFTFEVFFLLVTLKNWEKALCHDLRNFVVIVLVFHSCLYLKKWRRIFGRTAVKLAEISNRVKCG